jgi:myo-inositol-1(or 4)-monophosphatase
MHPYLNTALKAARSASDIIMRGYDRLDCIKVFQKDKRDFVTDIDQTAEREIMRILEIAYPQHGFIAEESGKTKGNEWTWIIDPLDGTINFIHGIPHFAISIALQYKNNIEHALIYDPVTQDLFTGSRGSGAYKNNHRIRVSNKRFLSDCIIGTGFPFNCPDYQANYLETMINIYKDCLRTRKTGSAALDLAYVASGQMDAAWQIGLKLWDIAAGTLLIREAGGLICDPAGGDSFLKTGNLVAGNPTIIKQMLKHVNVFEKQSLT